jgi:hypothetical protein
MNKRGFDGEAAGHRASALIDKHGKTSRGPAAARQLTKASPHAMGSSGAPQGARAFAFKLHWATCCAAPSSTAATAARLWSTAFPTTATPASARCARLRHHPLREPAQRGGHRAPLGATACCCASATSSRARASGPCRPASWSCNETTSQGAARETDEEAGAHFELEGAVLGAQRGAGRPGAPVLPRDCCRPVQPRPRNDGGPAVPRRPTSPGTRSPFAPSRRRWSTTLPTGAHGPMGRGARRVPYPPW